MLLRSRWHSRCMSGAASFPSHLATAERPRLGARPLCQFGPGPELWVGRALLQHSGPERRQGSRRPPPWPPLSIQGCIVDVGDSEEVLVSVGFLRLRQPDPETMTSLGTILPAPPDKCFRPGQKHGRTENDIARERSSTGPPAARSR